MEKLEITIIILSALLVSSEYLAEIPQIKSNSVFQLVKSWIAKIIEIIKIVKK